MILNANALAIPLADQSVHCIVTSPPYWGLRDYGTASWQGGDEGCDHKPNANPRVTRERNGLTGSLEYMQAQEPNYRDTCGKCGAIRIDSQLGLERTPEEYVANMVAVFRECWRVLRDDGTLWLNIGDSYAGNKAGNTNGTGAGGVSTGKVQQKDGVLDQDFYKELPPGIKPKDLVGIPWRLAFALQADGWYLRSDIIWNKPNPMPESVTDRPTKSHEYLFLLTKRERYYYDAEAVREEYSPDSLPRAMRGLSDDNKWTDGAPGSTAHSISQGRGNAKLAGTGIRFASDGRSGYIDSNGRLLINPAGRNRRSVWTIPTAPYKGAHFATFPPALVEPCIKAGTSERGCCPKCGKGWARVSETSYKQHRKRGDWEERLQQENGENRSPGMSKYGVATKINTTTGWQPACSCNAGDPIPALVFDPFVGSGTTVKVAYDLGRRGVGLDLSLKYLDEQATTRIHNGHVGRLV